MTLVKFKNSPIERTFNDLVSDFFHPDFGLFPKSFNSFNSPAVNVVETKDNFRMDMAVPGFSKADFDVKVENNLLTIKGEKKNEVNKEDEKFTVREFSHSTFTRTFTLPETVDNTKVNAEYTDGILKVLIPKKEEAKQKGAIEIKVS